MPATRAASSVAEPVCRYQFDGRSCRRRGPHRCSPRIAHVSAFFREVLVHTKGDYAGRPFIPARWQQRDVLAPLFGEVVYDSARGRYVRRYRTLYLFVARKNGKSELIAGIMLYLLAAEGEQSAELYGLALDRDQAGHVYRASARMVELSPALRERLIVVRSAARIVDPRTGSIYAVLAGDAPGALGANPSGGYIDELLTQPTRDLYDALRTGLGARAQPLLMLATTAENAPQGFAATERRWSERVLEDPSLDPARLVVMYRWPKGADWTDERNWQKVNPALGDYLGWGTLRAEFREALNNPPAERAFRQYRLNQPVNAIGRAIDLQLWDRGGGPGLSIAGQPAWGGLDLASAHDLAALAWVVRDDEQAGYRCMWRIFTPEANVQRLDRRTGGQASVWVDEGWLEATPGEVLDYQAVHARLLSDARSLRVQEIAYDPWGMTQLVQDLLDEGVRMVEMRQGWASMASPTSELLRLIAAGELQHGGNPVARWCAGNAVTRSDTAGNLKWDKERAPDKIDPIVALTMAIGRAMVQPKPKRSAYEEGSLVVV